MASEPRLRRAVAADRPALVALQEAAFAPNAAIIGGRSSVLDWDYDDVVARHEVWLAEGEGGLCGALVLESRAEDILLQSISVAPHAKGRGLGNRLLDLAEARAVATGRGLLRLRVNARMLFNVDWYHRKGFTIEVIETNGDHRRLTMVRPVAGRSPLSHSSIRQPSSREEPA